MIRRIQNIINRAEVSEKAIEAYLVKRAKEHGIVCLKYSNATATGYPDRLICLRGGCVAWVEIKSRGKKPTKLQNLRHNELARLGHTVRVVSSKEEVDGLITELTNY